MPETGHGIVALLHRFYPVILPLIQWLIVACIVLSVLRVLIAATPIRMNPFFKLFLTVLFLGGAAGLIWLVLTTAPLLIAKLALIIVLICGGLLCLYCLTQVGRWTEDLVRIQAECELATNLTFLQGEMTRAQLEQVSLKLQKMAEPEEREITETLFKSLSPIVMLYLRKEKSVIEWSLAAAGMGRDLFKHFWSPKKS
jgi:hypothetical protein